MRVHSVISKWIRNMIFPELSEKYLKHKKVTLHPNSFLDNRAVLYFETSVSILINSHLSSNYHKINQALSKKGMRFIYLPKSGFAFSANLYKELSAYVTYCNPYLFNGSSESTAEFIKQVISELDIELFYQCLGKVLGIPSDCEPCLIHSIDYETEDQTQRKWVYSVFYLHTQKKSILRSQIKFYISKTGIPKDKIFLSLKKKDEKNYDADERFQIDGSNISNEIRHAINALKSITNEKVLVTSLLYLFNDLQNKNPEACKRLSNTLFQKINNRAIVLSRIVVDQNHRIILPEYNNIEIELTPLPKAFYIFMLRHPEGIRFKDLSDHREELIHLYKVVSNRYDMDQIKKSIYDLTDIRSNSVNEKCSRIKEAFLKKFDESLAQHYFITGVRGELKLISLDRSLVHFSQKI